jgi:hypothetical protein
VKILKRGRLFAAILGAATVAVLALSTTDAMAATYSSPRTGTHTVGGAILVEYRALGQSAGPLGFPRTNELKTPRVFGRYNVFQHGSIYWSPSSGAHAIGGDIQKRWGALGSENSFLGFPTTNELPTPVRSGRYNHFQFGSIYWSPATGAHSIAGAIRDRWASMGWEKSRLGFPTSNEYRISGGRAQNFQCGSIQWTPARGTKVVGCAAPIKLTVSQENAQKSARGYLDIMSFSRSDLIDQLEYEGYSTGDATVAVDSLKVDWNAQAAKKAEEYLDIMPFSRSGLIDQLEYEGFTASQAEYGVSQAGL